MPRNGLGVMAADAAYPPAAGSVISLTDYRALIDDVVAELTDSLSRSGKGAMTDSLKLVQGAVGDPALTFAAEETTGLFLPAPGDLRAAIAGALIAKLTAAGLDVTGKVAATGDVSGVKGVFSGDVQALVLSAVASANSGLTLRGNKAAGDAGADVIVNALATRVAGKLLDIQNNGTSKVSVDYAGKVSAPDAALTTATIGTATITDSVVAPNAGQRFVLLNSDIALTSIDQSVLGVTVKANAIYELEWDLWLGNCTNNPTLFTAVTPPAGYTHCQYRRDAADAAGGGTSIGVLASVGTSIAPGNGYGAIRIRSILRNGANAGTISLAMRHSGNPQTCSIVAGSTVRYRRLDVLE